MARIKYAPDVDPIIGEHNGNTFQNSRIGAVMFRGQANDRTRNPAQNARKMNITHANGHWRNLTPTEQNAWSNFAATFPQPSHRNPAVFLSGYECFIKRQSYLFLAYGNQADFLTAPSLSETLPVNFTPSLYKVGPDLYFKLIFDTFGKTVDFHIFCSVVGYPSKVYQRSQPRYMGVLSNEETKTPYFGSLYRQNVLTDSRNAAPVGWHFPSKSEMEILIENCGGASIAAGNLKDTNPVFWAQPNVGATNLFNFNCRGIGECRPNFQGFTYSTRIWSTTPALYGNFYELQIFFYQAASDLNQTIPRFGQAIRCIKDDSELPTSMVGNDGTIYPVTKIGSQVWQALPSIESRYRNGDSITLISDSTTWGATTYPAMRYPQDNINYAFKSSPNVLNISEQYKNMFGIIPESGQCLQVRIVPASRSNGQFFTELRQNLIIE